MSAHQFWDYATPARRETILKAAGVPQKWVGMLCLLGWEELTALTREMIQKYWEGPKTTP